MAEPLGLAIDAERAAGKQLRESSKASAGVDASEPTRSFSDADAIMT